MSDQPKWLQQLKETAFYLLGALLIVGFVVLYFPQFLGINRPPPVIQYLLYMSFPASFNVNILPAPIRYPVVTNWATICTIAVNAAVFLLFLVFMPYRARVEWRSKGAFAAFILALFAEMYGIPLLLYILSPLVHPPSLDAPERSWLYNPLIFGWDGAVIGVWLTLIGMIVVAVGWHQIHRANGLVTSGIYRYVRHPQYTGIYLVMLGWLLHWETTLTLLMFPVLAVMYYFLARKEEQGLRAEFGERYDAYCRETFMFLPISLSIFKVKGT